MNFDLVTPESIVELIRSRETTRVEFKADISTPPGRRELESITKHMVAFTNSQGGITIFGVDDQGAIVGVRDKRHVEDTVAMLVRDTIDPPITPQFDWVTINGIEVLAVSVLRFQPLDFPRRDKNTRIYYVRIVSHSREATHQELRELFFASAGWRTQYNPQGGVTVSSLPAEQTRV